MNDLHCPVCDQTAVPAARIATFAVCAGCGASLILEADGTVRRATAMDSDVLMPGDRATLTKARSAVARRR